MNSLNDATRFLTTCDCQGSIPHRQRAKCTALVWCKLLLFCLGHCISFDIKIGFPRPNHRYSRILVTVNVDYTVIEYLQFSSKKQVLDKKL